MVQKPVPLDGFSYFWADPTPMEKKRIAFEMLIFENVGELSQNDRNLLDAATAAREHAYAPYSRFKVGAALLMDNGEVVLGSNQENASYPSGLCAERVAVFQAGSKFPGMVIKSLAVRVATEHQKVDRPAAPCGNCRQALIEYEQRQNSPISILLQGEEGSIYKCASVGDILPLAFNSSFLGDS